MSPEQNIRIRLRLLLDELGYPVYSYLPNGEGEFPILHVGEQFKQNERLHIDRLNGRTQITIHVWHNDVRQEGTVMRLVYQVEQLLLKEFGLYGEDINTELVMDDSTDVRLLHGIINVNIKY